MALWALAFKIADQESQDYEIIKYCGAGHWRHCIPKPPGGGWYHRASLSHTDTLSLYALCTLISFTDMLLRTQLREIQALGRSPLTRPVPVALDLSYSYISTTHSLLSQGLCILAFSVCSRSLQATGLGQDNKTTRECDTSRIGTENHNIFVIIYYSEYI